MWQPTVVGVSSHATFVTTLLPPCGFQFPGYCHRCLPPFCSCSLSSCCCMDSVCALPAQCAPHPCKPDEDPEPRAQRADSTRHRRVPGCGAHEPGGRVAPGGEGATHRAARPRQGWCVMGKLGAGQLLQRSCFVSLQWAHVVWSRGSSKCSHMTCVTCCVRGRATEWY